jgi:hypothetical protein
MSLNEELHKKIAEAANKARIDAVVKILRDRAHRGQLTLKELYAALDEPPSSILSILGETQIRDIFPARNLGPISREVSSGPALLSCMKRVATGKYCNQTKGHAGACDEDANRR